MTEAQFLAACKEKWPDKEVDRSGRYPMVFFPELTVSFRDPEVYALTDSDYYEGWGPTIDAALTNLKHNLQESAKGIKKSLAAVKEIL